MMVLRVNQVAFGLGHGVLGASPDRMAVWTQGCSLPKCPGCASRHTWSPTGGKPMPVETLLRFALARPRAPSGLTLSGGEPTDQAVAVTTLTKAFRARFPEAEIVLYTGLDWDRLAARHPELVATLDVAITGPYVHTCKATALTGSANQQVRLLTPLAKQLYRGWRDWPRHIAQVGLAGQDRVVTIGIPDAGRLTQAAQRLGARDASWTRLSTGDSP